MRFKQASVSPNDPHSHHNIILLAILTWAVYKQETLFKVLPPLFPICRDRSKHFTRVKKLYAVLQA